LKREGVLFLQARPKFSVFDRCVCQFSREKFRWPFWAGQGKSKGADPDDDPVDWRQSGQRWAAGLNSQLCRFNKQAPTSRNCPDASENPELRNRNQRL